MIKLQVIGNLGKDCVLNNVNGKNVMNFTVAHTERFKDAQGVQKDKTIWVDCAYWSDRTGIAPYLKKGTQVYVEGQPEVRTYQTQDGKQGATLTVRVQSIQLLGSRSEGQQSGGSYGGQHQPQQNYNQPQQNYQQQVASPSAADITEPLDDLPF